MILYMCIYFKCKYWTPENARIIIFVTYGMRENRWKNTVPETEKEDKNYIFCMISNFMCNFSIIHSSF